MFFTFMDSCDPSGFGFGLILVYILLLTGEWSHRHRHDERVSTHDLRS
jgi:hypothetical protein